MLTLAKSCNMYFKASRSIECTVHGVHILHDEPHNIYTLKTIWTIYDKFSLDIDECASRSLHKCGVSAVCVNLSPGYRCDCPSGYSGDGRFACEPVQVRTTCSSDFDCTNNAECRDNSCVCRSGFQPQGALCVDIDECGRDGKICGNGAVCVNNPGSYTCQCQAPLVGNPPKTPCKGKRGYLTSLVIVHFL